MPSGPSIIRGPSTPPPLHRTITDLLKERCTIQPDTLAVASLEEDRQLLWSDLRDRVDGLASGLAALGLSKGDRLGVMLGNRLEYMEASSRTQNSTYAPC
jgi:fatty-acyl-CoA synthase